MRASKLVHRIVKFINYANLCKLASEPLPVMPCQFAHTLCIMHLYCTLKYRACTMHIANVYSAVPHSRPTCVISDKLVVCDNNVNC